MMNNNQLLNKSAGAILIRTDYASAFTNTLIAEFKVKPVIF